MFPDNSRKNIEGPDGNRGQRQRKVEHLGERISKWLIEESPREKGYKYL
jgi:hypothetical protein